MARMRSAAAYRRALAASRSSRGAQFGLQRIRRARAAGGLFLVPRSSADQGEIHLRTRSGNETALTSEARGVLRDLDPMLPLYDVRTFSQHIERNLYLRRIPARMFAVLGPLLLGLAAIGIYAVVSYAVARRTREIGVRLAFGATSGGCPTNYSRELRRNYLGHGDWMGTCSRDFRSRDDQGPVNLPIFLCVPAILLGVATLACWIPARRATRIDPMAALRHE